MITIMRRPELERHGIQVPVLATVALGALPGPPNWAERLMRLGIDVIASGAAADTAETWSAAHAAVPFRPVKGIAANAAAAAALIAVGCRLVECATEPGSDAYWLRPDEHVVIAVDGASAAVEDPSVIGRQIVEAAWEGSPAALWVVASPGLEGLPIATVEAKLAALAEAAVNARLVLAKEQFGRD
jgi:hypothetical protein